MPASGARNLLLLGGNPVLNKSTFTGANGLRLTVYAPEIGGAWTERSGTWQLQANAATALTIGGNGAIATVDTHRADAIVQTTIVLAASLQLGLVCRYNPNDNTHWLVNLRQDTGVLGIYEYDGASYTARATATPGFTAATAYPLLVTLAGATIQAAASGVMITYNSAARNLTLTHIGLRQSATSTPTTADDFLVRRR